MDTPRAKRRLSAQSPETGAGQSGQNEAKKRCATPSIMNYFSPRPRPEFQQTPVSTSSPAIKTERKQEISTIRSAQPRSPETTPAEVSQLDASPHQAITPKVSNRELPNTPQISRSRAFQDVNNSPSCREVASKDDDDQDHAHLKYYFLTPGNRKDISKRRPDDPDYDEKTLHVPEGFLNSQTPALRQWWLIKQRNMDSVIFFKMGKFYELFNEDAVIGVNNLDIIYMKAEPGRPAHAGFPEVSFNKYSTILINRGFKVLRVEQTETPAMMEDRCQRTGQKGKFDKVVRREICQVTTKGTQMLNISDSVFQSSSNQYLLALNQAFKDSDEGARRILLFGVCFIDVTIGKLYIGQFEDDHNLSNLNILLAHHTPTEVIYERNNIDQQPMQALMKTGAVLRSLKPSKEFWPIKRALGHLKTNRTFINESGDFDWPPLLKKLFYSEEDADNIMSLDPLEEYRLALDCFGAIVYYLQSQMIAKQVLNCSSFSIYEAPLSMNQKGSGSSEPRNALKLPPMIMDHIALRNLEIFVDSNNERKCTLFDSINYCKTHFGQRLLKNWLCSPLQDISQIENRLQAVDALISNSNSSLMNEIVHILGQTPDLERMLARLKSQCFKSEGDLKAIMFDGNQHSKAKISAFLNLLTNFKRMRKFVTSISKTMQNCESSVLKRLLSLTTDEGLFPDYSATLDYFDTAFDHKTAQQTGKIIPVSGVDLEYDDCEKNIQAQKQKLEDYLEQQKKVIGCRQIEYFGNGKTRYQLQVPDRFCDDLPNEYRIESARKGVKRYYTPYIDSIFAKLTTLEEEMKKILDGIMSKIFEQFARKVALWVAAIECFAILDVLQGLANFVRSLKAKGINVCRPELLTDSVKPTIEYTDGRHPVLVTIDPNYISNSLNLDDRLLLLTGANMGGKSTLMRQTALIVMLAQIGCYVPASSLRLTPVDRIFSRLGASDRLLDGESTFYTELVETSAMLRCATKNSLLLLDELGRGTSTYDGTAIAYSVIQEISLNLKCRCLFSTHYHTLVTDFMDNTQVQLAHMACRIEKESDEEIDADPLKENLSFLYKIAEGPAARSYGFNVAKLAGIEDSIIKDAFSKAKEIETSCKVLSMLQLACQSGESNESHEVLKRHILASL